MMADKTLPSAAVFDVASKVVDVASVVSALDRYGVIVLRNLFDRTTLDHVVREAGNILSSPAIGGAPGYYKKVYGKRFYDTLLLGGAAVDLVVNNTVIDVAENYVNGEVILAETFLKLDEKCLGEANLPIHADFSPGYSDGDNPPLTPATMKNPIGVGGAIYLHETTHGAFCFSIGSHKHGAPLGGSLDKYPDTLQAEIKANLVTITGYEGDIILFDDRGFHGPEHQTEKTRTVILIDYYKKETFFNKVRTPIPVFLNDLGHINSKQMRVLGIKSGYCISYDQYHIRKYRYTSGYRVLKFLFDWQFKLQRIWTSLRKVFR